MSLSNYSVIQWIWTIYNEKYVLWSDKIENISSFVIIKWSKKCDDLIILILKWSEKNDVFSKRGHIRVQWNLRSGPNNGTLSIS